MRIIFLVVMAAVLFAPRAWAQGDPRDWERPGPKAEREMYYAQVRGEVNRVLVRWKDAWESDDANALAKLYTDEAIYYPLTGNAVQTRATIRDHFTTFLQSANSVHVQMIDFGTSGDLAFLTGRMTYQVQTATGSRQLVRTDLLLLRRRSHADWQIQTHLTREER